MKKNQVIKKNDEFARIINEGKRIKNIYYTIFYQPSSNNLYGISVPTKTGNAVTRNKIKRQLKNIIDNNKKDIQKNYDYVIIIKRQLLEIDFQRRQEELISLMKKIGDK